MWMLEASLGYICVRFLSLLLHNCPLQTEHSGSFEVQDTEVEVEV